MRVTVARERGAPLDEALSALLGVEPYLAYANFPPIGDRTRDLHRRWWLGAAEGQGALVARDDAARPLATLRLERRAFESSHFDMPIAKLDAPIAVADETLRLPALRTLYRTAWDTLRDAGFRHLSALASTQDRVACWALQELGAFHVGTKISWMQPLSGGELEPLTPSLRMTVHEGDAIRTLPRDSWRRLLEWTGRAFDRGPFVFDLAVPVERASAVYQVWTEKAFTGEWADVLVSIWDGDDIVAFHAVLLLRDLSEAARVGILGRGIGATLPGYHGLFTALQKACSTLRPLGAAWLEDEAQASTIASINVFGRLGHRCLRSTANFHGPLDPAPPPRRRG